MCVCVSVCLSVCETAQKPTVKSLFVVFFLPSPSILSFLLVSTYNQYSHKTCSSTWCCPTKTFLRRVTRRRAEWTRSENDDEDDEEKKEDEWQQGDVKSEMTPIFFFLLFSARSSLRRHFSLVENSSHFVFLHVSVDRCHSSSSSRPSLLFSLLLFLLLLLSFFFQAGRRFARGGGCFVCLFVCCRRHSLWR